MKSAPGRSEVARGVRAPPQPPPRPHLHSRKRPGRERGGRAAGAEGPATGAGLHAAAAAPSRAAGHLQVTMGLFSMV